MVCGWTKTKLMQISIQDEFVVEVRVELGNNKHFAQPHTFFVMYFGNPIVFLNGYMFSFKISCLFLISNNNILDSI